MSALGLDGRTALVVGATRGLGRATALRLAAEGVRVALTARTPGALDEVAEQAAGLGGDVSCWAADFTRAGDVVRVVDEIDARFGSIDILVNTIGVCEMTKDALSGDDRLWEEAFQSVVMAAVRSCRAVVPKMLERGRGAVVNVSANSSRHYIPELAHYSSMKVALAHFTKNLARQCARTPVRVNAVMPGFIGSQQVEDILAGIMAADDLDRQQAFEKLNHEILHTANWTNRLGDPSEYANVIAFLVSDQASYVNGAWINVDGGSAF